ncbi:MAG: glycosyltransferase [Chitinophagaceae bacterium]
MKFPKKNDNEMRQGDLIILKKHNPINNEKGVLLITYTEALATFAALYDLEKLSEKYQFVFEPSWWGYKNYQILLFYGLNTEIVVQCPYKPDYDFINTLGKNYYPINIGAGDWVDPNIFINSSKDEKEYDIAMVGNWSKIKRHEILFKTMEMMSKKPTVALIGYPSQGRNWDDIIKEAKKHHVDQYCTIYENIEPKKVSEILGNSKINLLLSKAEGANRGIYEGIFSGNIIVVYKHNKGVNLEQIKNVGLLSDDYELGEILQKTIDNYNKYDTRAWGLLNTGCINSTNKINNMLKYISISSGKIWENDLVCKCNRPNLLYLKEVDRLFMKEEYQNLENYLLT